MTKHEKNEVIDNLAGLFNEFKNIYVTNVASLNAKQTSLLRGELYKSGITMQIAKNTLIEKAMERSGRDFGKLSETLVGNTALMFCHEMKEPAKAIKAFRKKTAIPYLKGAAIDVDIFIGDNQLDTLMALKTKNELIGEIIGLLQSPAKNVISGLKSGGNKLAGILKTLEERGN